MRVKEIECSISGVIPSGSYENYRPGFRMVLEMQEGEAYKEELNKAKTYLRELFELEVNRAKTDLIDKQYGNIRFYEHNGKKYPSVTSILGWDTDWKITADELNQYGSRGTIVHKMIEMYLDTGIWIDPEKESGLNTDVAIVLGGSKKLHWNDCSYKAFFEANGKDIQIDTMEHEVINTEVGYGGRCDAIGTYKGKPAIFDWKTGASSDFRQLSAYAMCLETPINTLVIAPVGRSDTKQGYSRPKVSEGLDSEFKNFLVARKKFRQRFGV